MSVFAGVISLSQNRSILGASKLMLSHSVAPHHNDLNHFHDRTADIALKSVASESGYYSNENLCVVACGRIDDSPSLRDQLDLDASEVGTGRLLAAAYEKWREDIARMISGEFAFAIWDRRENSLYCGRDRFGRMPFSYMVSGAGIVFGTDFLAIALSASTPVAINDSWVIDYVNGTVSDEEHTPFKGVMRLPPACVLKWRNGELSLRKYWTFAEIGGTLERFDVAQLSRELEASIEKSTRDSTSVAMLSGGLDSSSIAIIARDVIRKKSFRELPTVSLVFDDFPEESERGYMDAVIGQGGFDPHFVNAQDYDVVSEINRLVRVQGAPTNGRGAPIHDQALARIDQLGFTSVLDGHGGDEVISSGGIMRFFELADSGRWLALIREMMRATHHSDVRFFSNFFGLYSIKGHGASAAVARQLYSRLKAPPVAKKPMRLLRTDWGNHAILDQAKRLSAKLKPINHVDERSFQESVLSSPLQTDAFETLHRQFRSHGLRPEFPYWQDGIVESCLRAPSEQKAKNGVPRSLLRSVMGERLPKLVANRTTKLDFTNAHLRSFRSSSAQIKEYATATNHAVFDYIEPDVFSTAVVELHDPAREIHVDAHRKVWTTMNLLLWFEMVSQNQSNQTGSYEVS